MRNRFRTDSQKLAADFGREEISAIDAVAGYLDPVRPKRSTAMRELVRLGFERWNEIHHGQSPKLRTPPLLDATENK